MRLYAPFAITVTPGNTINIPTTDFDSVVMIVGGVAGQAFSIAVSIAQTNQFQTHNGFALPAGQNQLISFARGLSGTVAPPAAGAAATLFPLGEALIFTNSGANNMTINYEAWINTDG